MKKLIDMIQDLTGRLPRIKLGAGPILVVDHSLTADTPEGDVRVAAL
jgi:hypothetical protein